MLTWRDRIFIVLLLSKQLMVVSSSFESRVFSGFEKNVMFLLCAFHRGVQNEFIECGHMSIRYSMYNSMILANRWEDTKSDQNN